MTITATSPATIPGHDELVGRAVALREQLWTDAAECDRTRRLTDRGIGAVTAAGLTRLMTPPRLGGYGTDMRTFLDVTTELGRGCCSTSWVTGVLNAGNFVVSLFPTPAQDEVWADDPDARSALVLGLPSPAVAQVDGGILVSGEWGYASGSLHAEWVCVLIATGPATSSPGPHFALMRTSDVENRDTWRFAGMRGTGSNTVVAERVFVPTHRVAPFFPFINGQAHLLADAGHRYRDSLMGLFSIGLLGSMIGGADAAFGFVRDKAPSRPVAATTYANQAESPTLQLDLAAASMAIESARLHARELADTVDAFARAGEDADLLTRGRARFESTYVAQKCREALDILVTAHGSSAFNETNPLQRIWRDVNVGSRHAGFGMGVPQQLYGRALVGGNPRDISFLV